MFASNHCSVAWELGGITGSREFLLRFVHGVRTFRTEELQGVIRQGVRIGQDLVVSQVFLVLVNQRSGSIAHESLGLHCPS